MLKKQLDDKENYHIKVPQRCDRFVAGMADNQVKVPSCTCPGKVATGTASRDKYEEYPTSAKHPYLAFVHNLPS